LDIRYAALTDHDTILGQEEFLSAARDLGICAVSGIEMNCEHTRELHILGYGFDYRDPALCGMLDSLAEHRLNRAGRIIEALAKHGYYIEAERVREIAGEGVIGRPHIAKALVEKGYVDSVPMAFRKLLGTECPGEAPRFRISHGEAIRLIRNAGGKAVLAHPGCMRGEDHEALVRMLVEEGLEGIEAYYPEHGLKDCGFFSELADRYGLFVTMGSDFHGGIGHASTPGYENRGNRKVMENLEKFMEDGCL